MLEKSEFLSAIRHNPLFQELSETEREQLLSITERKKFHKNQEVFSMNQKGQNFYLVEEGELLLTLRDGEKKIYEQGEIFGEVAIFTQSLRMGTIRALQDTRLLAFDGDKLFSGEYLDPLLSLKIVRGLTVRIVNYLNKDLPFTTEKLIADGENENLEFKEAASKSVKPAMLKTLSAFMNTSGGTLLVGVNDSREICGVEFENEKELENFNLSIIGMIKDRIGGFFASLVSYDMDEVKGKVVLRYDCAASNKPAFLKEGPQKEAFYIRSGPSNIMPVISDMLEYIRSRFG
ncbi:MAG: putative DNA binding domain-containing protein [Bacteroidia bacterium]|nr:putative DNA binding domain-containing protein [Bacteroidia bacterium]